MYRKNDFRLIENDIVSKGKTVILTEILLAIAYMVKS